MPPLLKLGESWPGRPVVSCIKQVVSIRIGGVTECVEKSKNFENAHVEKGLIFRYLFDLAL